MKWKLLICLSYRGIQVHPYVNLEFINFPIVPYYSNKLKIL